MSTTAIDGVVAAGHVVTWIIQPSSITPEPSGEGPWSIPLAALTVPTTVKIDCHMDFGDMSMNVTPNTRERQRMCQKVKETIVVSETIEVQISAVYDQQQALTEEVNEAYAALPKDADVYIARAYGWDSSLAPTAATKVDLVRATVQSRSKTEPTSAEEDLKFMSTLSGSAYWEDVTLTAA